MRQLSSFLVALGAHGAILIAEFGGGSLVTNAEARHEIGRAAAAFIELDGRGILPETLSGERDRESDRESDGESDGGPPELALARERATSRAKKSERSRPARAAVNDAATSEPLEESSSAEASAARKAAPLSEALDLTSFRIAAKVKAPGAGGGEAPRAGIANGAERESRSALGNDAVNIAAPRMHGGSNAVGDRSMQIAISNRRWRCPWPAEADRLAIHRESATLLVCVRADGVLESVELRRDPGFGFGASALRCAERANYSPARDLSGAALDACATIRVRFER